MNCAYCEWEDEDESFFTAQDGAYYCSLHIKKKNCPKCGELTRDEEPEEMCANDLTPTINDVVKEIEENYVNG